MEPSQSQISREFLTLKGKPIDAARMPENCSREVKAIMDALSIRLSNSSNRR